MKKSDLCLLLMLTLPFVHQTIHTSLQQLRVARRLATSTAIQRTFMTALPPQLSSHKSSQLQQRRMSSMLTTAHSPLLNKNGIQKRSFSWDRGDVTNACIILGEIVVTGGVVGVVAGGVVGVVAGGVVGVVAGGVVGIPIILGVVAVDAADAVENYLITHSKNYKKPLIHTKKPLILVPQVNPKDIKKLSLERQLMHECGKKYPDSSYVKKLIEKGADIHKPIKHNGVFKQPIDRALEMGHLELRFEIATYDHEHKELTKKDS